MAIGPTVVSSDPANADDFEQAAAEASDFEKRGVLNPK
jgi:hypothetical protein